MGPSSGDDGEFVFGTPQRVAATASMGPSSGDDGEEMERVFADDDKVASMGPSSGDDGELQTSPPIAARA